MVVCAVQQLFDLADNTWLTKLIPPVTDLSSSCIQSVHQGSSCLHHTQETATTAVQAAGSIPYLWVAGHKYGRQAM